MKGLIDSFQYLKKKRLCVAKFIVLKKKKDLTRLDFPYFMKVDTFEHKTDIGAVRRCDNLEEARKNLLELHKNFPDKRIMIQSCFDGLEIIVGLKKDEVFGRVLMVGFGGIFAEIKKDVVFRSVEEKIGRAEIKKMLSSLEGFDIFNSRKKFALNDLIELIYKIQFLDLDEADFNPVILNEKEAVVVDARF